MADFKDLQLVLPLDLEQEPIYKDLVKQNWQFTFSRQTMTSVYTKRVIGLIVAQMKEEGDMRAYYQIRAADIIKETGLDKIEVYKRLRTVIYELVHVVFFFENEKEEIIIPRSLLDLTRFDNPVGYNNGVLTVAFNPTLRDIIMELAHYSKYELGIYMRFSSWYSMRLWEILYAFRDKSFVEFDIETYREWMGCGLVLSEKTGEPKFDKKGKPKYIKYPSHSDMIDRTTQEPLKEFVGTELEFNVEPVTDRSLGKGRPPIIKIRFNLMFQKYSSAEKINAWSQTSEKFKKTYERLKKYNVSDDLIVKYSKSIGQDGLNKLLHEWDLRQSPGSKNQINNPEHYCNKVIREVGEKANMKIELKL